MSMPLLQTKLNVPPLRSQLVSRPQLLARLQDQARRPLTLVAAPAGFGKTTAVRAALNESDHAVAWLSLDEDDNDLARFFAYLLSALRTQQANLGETVLPLLAAPQTPPAKVILTPLLNDLATLTTPLLLVLDDYHLINAQPIHEAAAFLVDHLPPQLHLIITTRIDPPLPLARWRARNHLTEIRADDLRFLPDEATVFLNEVMGLRLTAPQIAALESRTEGWIAGLQLAALSMQGRQDVAGFIQAFSGSHRHLLSYLSEEVLNRHPEDNLEFLLQTSILDRLSAPLCDAVTRRNDSQQRLEKIEEANLFLVPLDDEGKWFRYHHLFAEVLRVRLQQSQPNLVKELHHRASVWYEQNDLMVETVNHTLAAEEWERAAWVLTQLVNQMAEKVILVIHAQTALNWLKKLPISVIRTNPTLCFYYASMFIFTNQLTAAEDWLKNAEMSVQPSMLPDASQVILGSAALFRSNIARVRGDWASAVEFARQALSLLPEAGVSGRAVAQMNSTLEYLVTGDVTRSVEHRVEEVIAQLRTSDDRFATFLAITNLARLQTLQGQLRQAATTFALAEQVAQGSGRPQDRLNGAAYYIGLGDLLREWGDLAAAQQHLVQGMELVHGVMSVDADVVALGYMALAKVRQASGELHSGLLLLDEFMQLARVRGYFPSLIRRVAAVRTQLWLTAKSDDLTTAIQWAETSGLHADDHDLPYLQESEYLTLARLLLAQQHNKAALQLLSRLLSLAEAGNRRGRVIEILLLQALAFHSQNLPAEAFTTLHRALTLAEPEGYIRLFIDEGEAMRFLISDFGSFQDKLWIAQQPATEQNTKLSVYTHKLLTSFDDESSTKAGVSLVEQPKTQNLKFKIQNLVEPLSERELEVLQLVAAGLSNGEIADRLIVSMGTVKTHINHIFGKLEAQSRTQAVARARTLGLVTD